MTRKVVYGFGLWFFVGATAMTIAAIVIPEWISWDTRNDPRNPPSAPVHHTYGLHARCSSITQSCSEFPRWEDCQGADKGFCRAWRTTGFLMSMAVVLELATAVAFLVPLLGGKQKRVRGWRVLTACLVAVAACQAAGMGIVAHLFNHDQRFFDGWRLDQSFVLCTVSWTLQVVIATAIVAAALILPEEAGYELIPNRA